jgi:hypothetical protein
MKLSYRGISYEYNPPKVKTTQSGVAGKYRGLDWRFRNLDKPPVLQPSVNLKYRGVAYQTPGSPAVTRVEPTKTPILSTQDKARSLMLSYHKSLQNRQESMLKRSAAELGSAAHS